MAKLFGPARLGVKIDAERVYVAEHRNEQEWMQYLLANPQLLVAYADSVEVARLLNQSEKQRRMLQLRKNEGINIPALSPEELEEIRQGDLVSLEVFSLTYGFGILSATLGKMSAQIDLLRKKEEREFLEFWHEKEI